MIWFKRSRSGIPIPLVLALKAKAAPVPTSAASEPTEEQIAAYGRLVAEHPCRICGEAHPFTCPYIKTAELGPSGDFVKIELRREFFEDYVAQIPHGPADMDVA